MTTSAIPEPEVRQHNLLSAPPLSQSPLQRSDSDPDSRNHHSPRTPRTPRAPSSASLDVPLHPDAAQLRSHTLSPPFVSSPLNPNTPPQPYNPPPLLVGTGTQMRHSMIFNRIASEDSLALTHGPSLSAGQNRASMILYRLTEEYEQRTIAPYFMNRHSVASNSGDSAFTLSYDSKYPAGAHSQKKLVAYPFDPELHIDTPEDDDALHDPTDNTPADAPPGITIRGFVNIGVLVLVILALLCLFIFYPVWDVVNSKKSIS